MAKTRKNCWKWNSRINPEMKAQMDEYNHATRTVKNLGRVVPFGKYRGTEIDKIPHDYLRWFVDTIDGWDGLKNAMKNILSPKKRKRKATRKRREPRPDLVHKQNAAKIDAEFRAICGR